MVVRPLVESFIGWNLLGCSMLYMTLCTPNFRFFLHFIGCFHLYTWAWNIKLSCCYRYSRQPVSGTADRAHSLLILLLLSAVCFFVFTWPAEWVWREFVPGSKLLVTTLFLYRLLPLKFTTRIIDFIISPWLTDRRPFKKRKSTTIKFVKEKYYHPYTLHFFGWHLHNILKILTRFLTLEPSVIEAYKYLI